MAFTVTTPKLDISTVRSHEQVPLVIKTYRILQPGQTLELTSTTSLEVFRTALQDHWPDSFDWRASQSGPALWVASIACLTKGVNQASCCGCCSL